MITNRSALLALQAVNAAGKDLTATQNRIATGLKIAGPKDNGAIYAIAQGMRAENSGWAAAGQSLSRARSALDVTDAALAGINDILVRVRELASAYSDVTLSDTSRQAIRVDIEAAIRAIDSQAKLASFDGLNFLSGDGIEATVFNTTSYSLPSSPDTPQSFLTPMSAGAAVTESRSMTTSTSYTVPYSSLTPDSFAQLSLTNSDLGVAAGTSVVPDRTLMPAGSALLFNQANALAWPDYGNAGRVDIWLDAFADPNALEIWQGNQRVAASGQPYVPGGTVTGPATSVAGQVMLSFDYDPDKGRVFEVRSSGSGAWAFEDISGPTASPAAAPSGHTVQITSRADPASLPAVNLRPETSGASPASLGVRTETIDGGSNAGRVDLLFDAFETPDSVTIYQNGVPVAATGQPYVPGGGTVGAATAVSGQTVLSFDYDPSNGQTLEFRFNDGNAHAGAGWVVGGLELYAAGSPAIASSFPTTTTQRVTTSTYRETSASLGSDPSKLTPETEAEGSSTRTFTVPGGDKSGRVDLWVDAYTDPDVVEVWHNGTRVAASGQNYVSGGGGVGPGAPAANNIRLSFDYDHTLNQPLEFRFNEGLNATGAWTVAGLVLQDASAPPPSGTVSTYNDPGEVFPDLGFVRTGDGDPLLIPSRNMTSAGLRLSGIDWNDPADLLARTHQAIDRAIEAATHFGTRGKMVEVLLNQTLRLRDTLETGIGNLVDADLARESARLQAQQVRQQLAAQTLGVANGEPRWLLGLFRS